MGVYLLRVSLPDRPGSLGAVASAMGTVRADISAVEIVEKYEGYAIDDFIVGLPSDQPADALVAACTSVPGVELIWISHYLEDWGLQGDVDVLTQMTEQPGQAKRILAEAAPDAFRSLWAMLVDREGQQVSFQTELAPDLGPDALTALGPLDVATSRELPRGWLPGWGETL
ncbi:MAG: amino acid-binding protein, partial [Propionibacteriaceae bacterium]|nr:amino acid-binding protein [Propionibacteriaceae bacterium]